MTVEKVKEQLNDHLGEAVKIKYNLGRNKYEEYEVVIKKLYNHVFLVETKEENNIKSFSYSDVITRTIRIQF